MLHALGYPAAYALVAGALSLGFGFVRLGHRLLDLLRDFREFRAGR